MPQTTYPLDPVAALAGMVVEKGRMRGRFECSETLNPGRLVEKHTDGKLRQCQTASALGNLVGAVPYSPHMTVGGYTAGFAQVPVLRTGQIWIEYVGTAPTTEQVVNISSSSTIATDRGKVTASAPSATVGVEIYAPPNGALKCTKVDTTLGLALVELNLP